MKIVHLRNFENFPSSLCIAALVSSINRHESFYSRLVGIFRSLTVIVVVEYEVFGSNCDVNCVYLMFM